jgi:hypothetical protein
LRSGESIKLCHNRAGTGIRVRELDRPREFRIFFGVTQSVYHSFELPILRRMARRESGSTVANRREKALHRVG